MATYKVFVTMLKGGSQTQRNYTVQADEAYLKSVMANGGDKKHLAQIVQTTYPETQAYTSVRVSEYKKE